MFADFAETLPPPPARPPGTAADWTIPQNWAHFGAEEHRVWDVLYARQRRKLAGRAVATFEKGLDSLLLSRSGIPNFDDLNERLFERSGWTVVAVPGLLPDEIFFAHLARRQFPAGNFIRPASSLDYLEEPDVFHDVFGHVPMLADRWFADFMQRLGEEGLKAVAKDRVGLFSRLYWFTVEFGSSSTAPASPPASARPLTPSTARGRSACPSTSSGCFECRTAPTASSRSTS
jgi:phenylalanine-4-hydroxylase